MVGVGGGGLILELPAAWLLVVLVAPQVELCLF